MLSDIAKHAKLPDAATAQKHIIDLVRHLAIIAIVMFLRPSACVYWSRSVRSACYLEVCVSCALTRGDLWEQVESGTIVAQVDEVSGMVYFQEDKIEDFGSTQSIERSGPHVLRKWGKRAAVVLVGG